MLYGWSELDTVHEMNTTMASFLFEFDAIPTWCHTSKWNHVLSIWLQTSNKLPGSVGAFTMCWVWVERRKNSDPSSISNTIYSKLHVVNWYLQPLLLATPNFGSRDQAFWDFLTSDELAGRNVIYADTPINQLLRCWHGLVVYQDNPHCDQSHQPIWPQ